MYYHLAGGINAVLFVLSLAGLVTQLAKIWQRRSSAADRGDDEAPTAVLSLNYFSVSFLAYYAFFVYGYSIRPFNHYLVWPRLIGCALVFAVLWEIARDRRDRVSVPAFGIAAALLVAGAVLLLRGTPVGVVARLGPQVLSVVATAFIVQSLVHQIFLIRQSGRTGAISWPLHVLTSVKDVSTLLFGLAMGLLFGWPLILMGGASAAVKAVLLWQFRWAAHTPLAAARRSSSPQAGRAV